MSYRLYEAYDQGEDLGSITLQGKTFPLPCVVEDSDAYRWFVVPAFSTIIPGLWARASAAGTVGLVAPMPHGRLGAISSEQFLDQRSEALGLYRVGVWAEFDSFPAYRDLVAQEVASRPRQSSGGFVHLHTHTEYSPMDGRSKVPELTALAVADGNIALAGTDHGNCSVHPELQRECEKAGIKPIFGIEGYFVGDRKRRPVKWFETEDGIVVPESTIDSMGTAEKKALIQKSDIDEVRWGYQHIVLLAQTQQGLKNVWGASTESFRDGLYQVPRMDWHTLERHNEGVIATSGCLRGPLAGPLREGNVALAQQNLARFLDIFGDRFYIELHANTHADQPRVNQALVELAQAYGVPCIAVVDSHYPTPDKYLQHKAWVSVQTDADVSDETDLFANNISLHMQTEAEVRQNLAHLPPDVVDAAIANTVSIAESCEAHIEKKVVMPIFSKKGGYDHDAERLIDLCLENWHLTIGPGKPSQDAYVERFEREMGLLIPKKFCGYFLQVSDYVQAMRQQRVMVGPGRGSGGGCLVAYLSRITGIDPVEANLPFERFMTEGRTALPDFDVDFPASKRPVVQDYITNKYGFEHVVRVGTHIRVKNKGILKDLSRAMKSLLPEKAWKDFDEISKIIESAEAGTAGLGLSWEELWAQEGDLLQPYREEYPQVFEMADDLVGLLKTYGSHPAGLVVSDDVLTDALPLRASSEDDGQMIAQFAMNDLEAMGYIKFDILTLRTLDTIQMAVDLIYERRGIQINFDEWIEEYADPEVWGTISGGNTLGMFQIETATGVQMSKQVKPYNISQLADVLTLVRPGPKRSGLTQLYLDRRAGQAQITIPDPRLEQVLADTYGCILYQEQVMQAAMILAGYNSDKADEVRKILGKKKVELVAAAGREFVEGCATYGMRREDAEHLWEQLAEFAKYSFGKAHAWAYAVLSYWTGWLKVHYPVETYTSLLSTVKGDRIPEFVSEARRTGFNVAVPDINQSGRGFSPIELGVRYGLDSLSGIGEAALEKILPGQPYTSFLDFRERSGVDSGVLRKLVRVGAFDSLGENRRGLETLLEGERTGDSTKCVFKDESLSGPNGLPCGYDWASEPLPINERTGRTLKAKPIPKKCTKACRRYTAPEPLDPTAVEPYTDEDIREIEMEMLGIHLSSTVFDRLEPGDRAFVLDQAELLADGPEGTYYIGATVSRIRRYNERSSGAEMAFIGLMTEKSDLDVTVFKGEWAKYQANLRVGTLAYFEVYKNNKGLSLRYMSVIP